MSRHVSQEELLDRPALERLQRAKLSAMLAEILKTNRFYRRKINGPHDGPYAELPFTAREELRQDQLDHPPYGTNLTYPLSCYRRLHQTSGTSSGAPLRCLDRAEDWAWWRSCWRTIYRAAGVTAEDRFIFPFSFGPFIGFWAAFEAALEMGNLCLPAGGMTTPARLRFMSENDVTVVCCTPTYALRMAEAARAEGVDPASSKVRALFVAGEPGGSIPATRAAIERAFGARVFDHAGMTEVGAYAFECLEAPGGLHINEGEFIAEVIDPSTSLPTVDGEAGELVLTNLGRWGMPLIRYRTGDRVRLSRGRCRCGRCFARIEGGILGRTDDMLIIRGNNVYPSAVEAILREFPAVAEYRLIVAEQDHMTDLRIEVEPASGAAAQELVEAVTWAIRDRLNFRPCVASVSPGTLPRFEMKAKRVVRQPQTSIR